MSQTSRAMTRRALAFTALWAFCGAPAASTSAEEPTPNWIRGVRAGAESGEELPSGPPTQIRTLRGGQRGTESPFQGGVALPPSPTTAPREPRREMAPAGTLGSEPPPLTPLVTKPTVLSQPPAAQLSCPARRSRGFAGRRAAE